MTMEPRRSYFHPVEVAIRAYMRQRWRFPRVPGLALERTPEACPGVACSAAWCSPTSCTCAPCACVACRAQRLVATAKLPAIHPTLMRRELEPDEPLVAAAAVQLDMGL
jgi:hypothetical protein